MASTSAGPWSVKGVDPRSREIAKDLARRSGMTLGEWLNRFIAETGATDAPTPENLEAGEGRPASAAERAEVRKLIDALQSLSARLDRSEAESSAALQAMRESYHALEDRLAMAETRVVSGDVSAVERRFETLAAELHEKVEAGRAEIAETLRQAAEGQFEKVENALRDLSGHVEQTERRSHRAIERLGEEMMRVATLLNSRVASSENRSAEAVERASGEIAKVAVAVEGRVGQAEQVQAEALERLSGEISRIAERLADRIAGSERRSAAAIDDIGLQVTQAADRIDQRYDRATQEVTDRLRDTEQRTASLLAEARERLAHGGAPAAGSGPGVAPIAAAPAPPQPEPVAVAALPAVEPLAAHPEPEPEAFATAQAEPDAHEAIAPEPVAARAPAIAERAAPAPSVFADLFDSPAGPAPAAPAFEPVHDFSAADLSDPFGPLPPLEPLSPFGDPPLFGASSAEPEDAVASEPQASTPAPMESLEPHADPAPVEAAEVAAPEPLMLEPAPPLEPLRPKTTKELLESAREAARAAAAGPAKADALAGKRFTLSAPKFSMPSLPSLPKPSLPKLKKKDAGLTLRTAVVASGTAAAICVTAVGAFKVYGSGSRPTYAVKTRTVEMARVAPTAARPHAYPRELAAAAPTAAPPPSGSALAAVALTAPAVDAAGVATPAKKPSLQELYAKAARRIEGGDAGGLSDLFKAAGRGVPAAQLYLAKLYEEGAGGLSKDPPQARRWTARAAQGGDVKAMHNLGLYYFEGEGGEKNAAAAADWFKRAADLGLQDSQYNLARLYQQGVGVAQNGAEAYKWYLVAAANGDAGARNDALAVRKTLGPDEAAAAERSAALFQSQARAQTPPTSP